MGAVAAGATVVGAPGAATGAAAAEPAAAATEPAAEEATGEGDVEPVAGWASGVPGLTSYEEDGDPGARSDSTTGEGVTKPGGGGIGHRAGGAAAHRSMKGRGGLRRRGRSRRNLKKREHRLDKVHMPRGVHTMSDRIIAPVTFGVGRVAKCRGL